MARICAVSRNNLFLHFRFRTQFVLVTSNLRFLCLSVGYMYILSVCMFYAALVA